MTDSFTKISSFIHNARAEDIPLDVMHMSRCCLVDLIAVWASGMTTDASRIARDHAVRRYGNGTVLLPFDGRPVNPVGYAFAGAATIDSIDGHDGHQLCKGHAGVAILPALLGELGNTSQCSLDELLTHMIVGYEIAIRAALSLHATVPDYHSSGAWNALGCAAVSARLRQFSSEQTRHALGIAEYYGPRAQMMRCIDHPSMVKDSSSWGALAGVTAADLAEDGFTGAPALTCEAAEVSATWEDIGHNWRILETNFKAYPVCRWSHPAIEAVLSLMNSTSVKVDDIEAVIVTTFHEATRLVTRRPIDGDAAQYSLPLTVALGLLHGSILPEHLDPDHYDRPEVWRIVDLISFAENDQYNAAFPGERYADVTCILKDGRRIQSDISVARGNYDAPLPDSEILHKLESYAAMVLPSGQRNLIASILSDSNSIQTSNEFIHLLQTAP